MAGSSHLSARPTPLRDWTQAAAVRQTGQQLLLPLERSGEESADFIEGAANVAARAAVVRFASGATPLLALVGPEAAGKTALIESRPKIMRLAAETLLEFDRASAAVEAGAPGLAIDDVSAALARLGAAAEQGLFHLINLARERGAGLLLADRRAPAHWATDLPDLRTRLATAEVARIEPPDDALGAALLDRAFRRRGLKVAAATLRYLAVRMARDYATPERVAEALDQAALREQRAVTPQLAAAELGWGGAAW